MVKELKDLLTFACLLGWFTTAFAADLAKQADLLALPWVAIGVAGGISLWGGLAATLQRALHAEDYKKFPLELLRDMVASASAGFLVFALGMWQKVDVWLLAFYLMIGGYAGTLLLEALMGAIVSKVVKLWKVIKE